MKTRDLITRLNELDPKGDCEVYIPYSRGGAILSVDKVSPSKNWCEFFDTNENFVVSNEITSIAIFTLGLDEWIERDTKNVKNVILNLDEESKIYANSIIDAVVDEKVFKEMRKT